MDLPPYDPSNIFARVLRGEIPAFRVFENEHALAFMDIMPRADGHTLVISKAPARNIFDIAPEALAELIKAVQTVAKAVRRATDADGITIQQFSERAGGQEVFHIHFHVLPRLDGVPLRPHTGEMMDKDKLSAYAEKIRAAFT